MSLCLYIQCPLACVTAFASIRSTYICLCTIIPPKQYTITCVIRKFLHLGNNPCKYKKTKFASLIPQAITWKGQKMPVQCDSLLAIYKIWPFNWLLFYELINRKLISEDFNPLPSQVKRTRQQRPPINTSPATKPKSQPACLTANLNCAPTPPCFSQRQDRETSRELPMTAVSVGVDPARIKSRQLGFIAHGITHALVRAGHICPRIAKTDPVNAPKYHTSFPSLFELKINQPSPNPQLQQETHLPKKT